MVEVKTKRVICVAIGKGRDHDFALLKSSETHFAKAVKVNADKGYQGLKKLHLNSELPHKKPKGGTLTIEQKHENRLFARERIVVEHVNRRFKRPCPKVHLMVKKVFRILGERYRNRRKRYGLRVNLIAGIYNLDNTE